MTDSSWKEVVQSLKAAMVPDRDVLIRATLEEAAGKPLAVREARKRLFLLTEAAVGGAPRLIAIEGHAIVCLISLSDLVQVLAGPPPSLADVMEKVLTKRSRPAKTET